MSHEPTLRPPAAAANDATSQAPSAPGRRRLLGCMAAGTGLLFGLSSGVLTPRSLARAGTREGSTGEEVLFAQISDTHIGFHKEANPDVEATLARAIDRVNAAQPQFVLHTGDITHRATAEEFERAQAVLSRLRTSELHFTPGEHDALGSDAREYLARFGAASQGRGYYSFDRSGVHFVCLVNVLGAGDGGAGTLGASQLDWVRADLAARGTSTPIVIFAHMPLWDLYRPWGWGTSDASELLPLLRRFGAVTVLNGHVHQIVHKLEGSVDYYTAASTAYPQPAPGEGPGPGPKTVPPDQLARALGIRTVRRHAHPARLDAQELDLA